MRSFITSCRDLLQRPLSVLTICSVAVALIILLDGTLFRIWSLNRDRDRLEGRIAALKVSVAEKEHRITESNRPEFIERQVREQLDFVRDGDLVFVFSDSPLASTLKAGTSASR
jgi:cell division protein FtsB